MDLQSDGMEGFPPSKDHPSKPQSHDSDPIIASLKYRGENARWMVGEEELRLMCWTVLFKVILSCEGAISLLRVSDSYIMVSRVKWGAANDTESLHCPNTGPL